MVVESESSAVCTLLDRAQAGDTEAFDELCRIHAHSLLRQALLLSGNLTRAEDLTQDTLVEAWRCLARYNGQCRFFTWLCAILLNRFRNTLRKNRFWSWFDVGWAAEKDSIRAEERVADDAAWPDQAAQLADQTALVRKCVQALPRKHREVIYLRFYVDDSLEGIAAALGCSVGTVKSRLFHALEKLRAMKDINAPETNRETKTA